MSKKLRFLVIHCSATPEGRDVTPNQIISMHTSKPPRGRGWSRVGYSDLILLDGTIHNLHKYNDDSFVDPWEITNGAAGINSISRHICYIGGTDRTGKPKDTRNKLQLDSMFIYIHSTITLHPHILIAGHNQFAAKACPSFNVPTYLRSLGVQKKNIFLP